MEDVKSEGCGPGCDCGKPSGNKKTKTVICLLVLLAIGAIFVYKAKNAKQTAPANKETAFAVPELNLPTLIDLGAGKCIPCKMMAPILEELKNEYKGQLKIVFIDVWENKNEASKYAIKMIPTQIFYDASGKELYRHEGFFAKTDILDKWKKLGFQLEKTK